MNITRIDRGGRIEYFINNKRVGYYAQDDLYGLSPTNGYAEKIGQPSYGQDLKMLSDWLTNYRVLKPDQHEELKTLTDKLYKDLGVCPHLSPSAKKYYTTEIDKIRKILNS